MYIRIQNIAYILCLGLLSGCFAPFGQTEQALSICPVTFGVDPQEAAPGEILTIKGRNFTLFEEQEYSNRVFVNGTVATIHSITGNELKIIVPQVSGGTLSIDINVGNCDWKGLGAEGVKPIIADMSPRSGPFGTDVTITGENLSIDGLSTTVSMNGTNVGEANLKSVTERSIVFTVPEGAESGLVSVELNGNTAPGFDFTYVFTAFVGTLAGAGVPGYAEGRDNAARFNEPQGIAVDKGGNIFVSDTKNHVIRKITSAGTTTLYAGKGEDPGYNDDRVSGEVARFGFPHGLSIDPETSNLYVAEGDGRTIRMILPSGQHPVSTIAGRSGFSGDTDLVPGIDARFRAPKRLVFSSDQFLYVSDEVGQNIRKINTETGQSYFVSTLAGAGRFNPGNSDGAGTAAKFNSPLGITIDPSTLMLYVVGRNSHRVRSITATGQVTTIAGSTIGHSDGVGNGSKFNSPEGVVADGKGNLYIADTQNHLIRKISLEDNSVSTLCGSLLDGAGFIDGKGGNAQFNEPRALAYDVDNNIIYVADSKNHAIRKIELR